MPRFKCFHNGIILIVICFKLFCQDSKQYDLPLHTHTVVISVSKYKFESTISIHQTYFL